MGQEFKVGCSEAAALSSSSYCWNNVCRELCVCDWFKLFKKSPDIGLLSFVPTKQLIELNERLAPGFDKTSLGVGRVIIFYVWFFALYFMVKRFAWIYEKNRIGRALTMLGQNSLYVYIVHSLLVFSVSLVWPKSTGLIGNILIDVAVISTIVFLVRKRVFFAYIPR